MNSRLNVYFKTIASLIVSVILMAFTNIAFADDSVSLARTGGEGIFLEKCGMCHRPTGMGTGILARRMDAELALLENRTDLQEAFINAVVRNGLNTMFPLSRAEVSDAQLAEIIQYLEE